MSKTRLIPGFAGSLIARALDIYGPRIVDIIPSLALKAFLVAILEGTRDLVKAISDNNPDNQAQVMTILREFFRVKAIPLVVEVVRERIGTINNPKISRGLELLSIPVLGTVELLTDDNPENAAQAETVLDDFILNPQVQEYVVTDLTVPILEKVINDPLILSFVLEALEQGIAEGARELADIEVFDRGNTVAVISAARERAIAAT